METLNINGSNVVNALIPAGFSTISTAAGGTITLGGGEASADILTLNDGPGAGFTVVVPVPSAFQADVTSQPIIPPAVFNPPKNAGSWVKVINNDTGQIATIKGTVYATGLPTAAGLALAGGGVKLVAFDGVNTPYTLT
jgi:hypothetical protein